MNKPKPVMKREVQVSWSGKHIRSIHVYATPDYASDIRQFGRVMEPGESGGPYMLEVDPRYSFDEVLAYISTLGQESESEQ